MTKEELVVLAKATATKHDLDPVLVCAVIEQESGWNTYATRFERDFFTRYVMPLGLKNLTEATSRAFSYGLMQIMGQVAREQGSTVQFLTHLCDPEEGVEQGCIKLKKCLDKSSGDVTKALLCYNGGSNQSYPVEVQARMKSYA